MEWRKCGSPGGSSAPSLCRAHQMGDGGEQHLGLVGLGQESLHDAIVEHVLDRVTGRVPRGEQHGQHWIQAPHLCQDLLCGHPGHRHVQQDEVSVATVRLKCVQCRCAVGCHKDVVPGT